MISIIGSVLGMALAVLGNILVAKWISAARLWWDSLQNPKLKAEVERQYQVMNADLRNKLNQGPPI